MPRVTITIPEHSPQAYSFDLNQELVTVGRHDVNDIVIGCGSVSGKHAEMHRVKGAFHLIDVGSTNGLNIDGVCHQTVVLHAGITVKLGEVEFGFSLTHEEMAVLTSEIQATTTPAISADEERAQAERAEAERAEAERAEAERAQAERAQAERAQAERAEAERAEAERAEAAQAQAAQAQAAQAQAAQAQAAQAQAEQAQAAQAQAAQAQAAQAQAAQAQAEQAQAEQAKAEQAKAEQAKAEQAKAEQAKAEQAKAEQAKAEQAKAEQAKAEQAKAEQAQADKAKAEKKERANQEAIAKKAGKSEKRKRTIGPANSDEYYESKRLKIGSGITLFVLIAIAVAFLYGGATHSPKDTGVNPSKEIVNKEDTKDGPPTEVADKPEPETK